MTKRKPKKSKGVRAAVKRGGASVPCPKCGSPSRVRRTSRGKRIAGTKRDYVHRERYCIAPAKHKFTTEERARGK
jgi:hypothetical protein